MNTTIIAFLYLLLCFAFTAHADTFGSGSTVFDIEFVDIGNPGNPDDTKGNPNPVGKVDYVYRIGKYEISEEMIDKANTLGNSLELVSHALGESPILPSLYLIGN